MNTNFKKTTLALAIAAVMGAAMQAADAAFDPIKMVEQTKTEGEFIVRNMIPLNVKDCAGDFANDPAKLALAEKVVSRANKTHKAFRAMRVGAFTSAHFGGMAPKGKVKIGDQVVAKAVPRSQAVAGECSVFEGQQYLLELDYVVKHHEGNLLYVNGNFMSNVDKDGNVDKGKHSGSKKDSGSPVGFDF